MNFVICRPPFGFGLDGCQATRLAFHAWWHACFDAEQLIGKQRVECIHVLALPAQLNQLVRNVHRAHGDSFQVVDATGCRAPKRTPVS